MREGVGDPGEGGPPALAAVRDGFRRGLEEEVRCGQDGGGRAEQVRPLYRKGRITLPSAGACPQFEHSPTDYVDRLVVSLEDGPHAGSVRI